VPKNPFSVLLLPEKKDQWHPTGVISQAEVAKPGLFVALQASANPWRGRAFNSPSHNYAER